MSSINELFVPYAESLELKELGFDEPCFAFLDGYNGDSHLFFKPRRKYHWLIRLFKSIPDITTYSQGLLEYEEGDNAVLAPTFSQAFKFFRDKYNMTHSITDFIDDETGIEWDYEIAVIGTDSNENGEYIPLVDYSTDDENRKFKSYEQAELGCLRKLIEICKNTN